MKKIILFILLPAVVLGTAAVLFIRGVFPVKLKKVNDFFAPTYINSGTPVSAATVFAEAMPGNGICDEDMRAVWMSVLDHEEPADSAEDFAARINTDLDYYENFAANTVFVCLPDDNSAGGLRYSDGTEFDYLACVSAAAAARDHYTVLSVCRSDLSTGTDQLGKLLEKYGFDALYLRFDGYGKSREFADDAVSVSDFLRVEHPGTCFGCEMPVRIQVTEKKNVLAELFDKRSIDFAVISALSSIDDTDFPFTPVVQSWNTFAASYPGIAFYWMHDVNIINEKVHPGQEIEAQMEILSEQERIRGSVFYPSVSLQQSESASIRLSERFFRDDDAAFAVKGTVISQDNASITFTGTSFDGHKVLNDRTVVDTDGGDFAFSLPLAPGLNRFLLKNNGYERRLIVDNITDSADSSAPTPYSDNGFGRALMCRIDPSNAAIASPVCGDYDTFHPDLFSPAAGTLDYVKSIFYDEGLRYELYSGFSVYASECTLLNNAYIMPFNKIACTECDDTAGDCTEIVIHTDWTVPVIASLLPQDYTKGYENFSYNVSSFTAEYLDLNFCYTSDCEGIENLTFADDSPIASCRRMDSPEGNVVLRFYLREKGKFCGYTVSVNEITGNFVFRIKKQTKGTLAGKTVMIDPGHGGVYMTGTALNDESVSEKEVTLLIAEKVKAMLSAYGATVIMTREKDISLSLEKRQEMCDLLSPDLFVSIHCDGVDDEKQSGTHTFYYKPYSQPLAECIHNRLVYNYSNYLYSSADSNFDGIDKDIKYYPFYVTRTDTCPSVLVETGFMSNDYEGQLLADDNCRSWLADAITNGIIDYFNR